MAEYTEYTEYSKQELIDFALTQDKFGTHIEHEVRTVDDDGCDHTAWLRAQYDIFSRNDNGFYIQRKNYDNVANTTIEWCINGNTTTITSNIIDVSVEWNRDLHIDPFTVFKFLLSRTSDADYAWSRSGMNNLNYEAITWLTEIFVGASNGVSGASGASNGVSSFRGEKENILETYRGICDELKIKYTLGVNKISIDQEGRRRFNEKIDALTDIKSAKFTNEVAMAHIKPEYIKG